MDGWGRKSYHSVLNRLLVFASTVILLCGLNGCSLKTQTTSRQEGGESLLSIKRIYLTYSSFFGGTTSYKIDLENKKAWIYFCGPNDKPRDSESKNEGYYFWKNLEEDKIEIFLAEWVEKDLDKVEGKYEKDEITDGKYWYLRQVGIDNTETNASGYEAYPDEWDEIGSAFEGLTGYQLMHGSKPTPKFYIFGRPIFWE